MENERQWEFDIVYGFIGMSEHAKTAKVATKLAERIREGWEIVAANGSSNGNFLAPSSHWYYVLLRREPRS